MLIEYSTGHYQVITGTTEDVLYVFPFENMPSPELIGYQVSSPAHAFERYVDPVLNIPVYMMAHPREYVNNWTEIERVEYE